MHYTILEASEPATKKRLIKLRNPFLPTLDTSDQDKPVIYTGPWDLHTDWKQYEFPTENGITFVALEDFSRWASGITVGMDTTQMFNSYFLRFNDNFVKEG